VDDRRESGRREWIRLDLGAPTLFNRLTIDNTANAGQWPRALNIETSSNGSTWTSVATQPGTDGLTTVKFAPQVARYVRVTQTGAAAAPWSVGEINLYSDPVLFNGTHTATATSNAPGTNAQMTLDGNVSTVWQSGAPQAPGQSLTIDLGRNVDMDKVLFDAGATTANDYPRVYDVFTSYDNANWTKVASGYGANRVVQADFKGPRTVAIFGSPRTAPRRSGGRWPRSRSRAEPPSIAADGSSPPRWAPPRRT
jgi:hypothetical protein